VLPFLFSPEAFRSAFPDTQSLLTELVVENGLLLEIPALSDRRDLHIFRFFESKVFIPACLPPQDFVGILTLCSLDPIDKYSVLSRRFLTWKANFNIFFFPTLFWRPPLLFYFPPPPSLLVVPFLRLSVPKGKFDFFF